MTISARAGRLAGDPKTQQNGPTLQHYLRFCVPLELSQDDSIGQEISDGETMFLNGRDGFLKIEMVWGTRSDSPND